MIRTNCYMLLTALVALKANAVPISSQSSQSETNGALDQGLDMSGTTRPVCRALALSSGASKGAFEAGAMLGLIRNGGSENFAWDVISGVSAGSINATMASLYSP